MQALIVSDMFEKTLVLDVTRHTTVEDIQDLIGKKIMAKVRSRVWSGKRPLSNEITLEEIGFQHGDILYHRIAIACSII